jgi:hypothetical protein
MPRWTLLLSLLPTVSGCNLLGLDGRCGPESREVLTSIEPTELVAYGQFNIIEREEAPRRSMSWLLESGRLRGRIEQAALVVRESGQVLAVLPVAPGTGDLALQSPSFEYAGPVSFDRVIELAREERLALVLETSIPQTPRIELPLELYLYQPWSQAYCS